MKKLLFTTLCLFALMATGASLMAQEITITLNPGWTWISYTRADTLTFAEALGYFTPLEGDMINSQEHGSAVYRSGRWRGALQQFTPGVGYMYNSNRTEQVSFVYTHAYQPEVNTLAVSGITSTSATVGGNLLNDGGATMRQCGICWGTNENPTISNNVVLVEELTQGEYALELTNLIPGTTYHARAFATNSVGTTYGEDVSFTTQFVLPTVTTNAVSGITTTTAIVGGQFSFVGNCFVTECGVCYRTEEGTETCIVIDATNNTFSTTLQGLTPNTTYFVRAYATNGAGTAYGEEMSFTTLEDTFPQGAINGLFSINENGGQVYFSQGNLQYIGSAGNGDENNTGAYWKFADKQWDYFSYSTGQEYYNVTADRDLFGWGTSGYNHGAVCYQPWSTSMTDGDYSAYGNSYYNLYDQNGQADWGYNAIANGGNQENSGWRTPTIYEWHYLCFTRVTTSGIRWALGTVNGAAGAILLPDEWDASIFTLNNVNGGSYNSNIITAEEWTSVFEVNGAVFLPAAGDREGSSPTSISFPGERGNYASSSYCVWWGTDWMEFEDGGVSVNIGYGKHRSWATSVRLVRNAPAVPPTVTTQNVTGITNMTANAGGQIINNGGATVTECGICYRTEQGAETYVASDAITNTFSMILEGLTPSTTYFVRAYATNEAGMGYGEEVSFSTLEEAPAYPIGAINGLFTINAEGGQVYFSQGNLQYKASTNTWRFAEYQWDYVGTQTPDNNGYYGGTVIGSDNKNISGTYNGWIDLFGWGTGNNPTNSTPSSSVYSSFTDWGNNSIINGGNQENSGWRTPTNEEWNYIINDRVTASGIRYAKAVVNDVKGVVVLPDNWLESTYTLNNTNSNNSDFNSNIINAEEWTNTLESNGAVFLPAAGYRYSNVQVYYAGGRGFYWSASYDSWDKAYSLNFSINSVNANSNNARFDGHSVRLVRRFPTPAGLTTFVVTGITNTVATVGGQIEDDGGSTVTECGICYRTEQGEETCIAIDEINNNFFSTTLQGLTPNTTYYIRAYAINATGTGYGEEVSFTTLEEAPAYPIGAINGLFTINAEGGQVYFSQGNLQYKASTNTWRFAEYQWDYVGTQTPDNNGYYGGTVIGSDNKNISGTYNGWIDLFGWGTGNNPTNSTPSSSVYSSFTDWGNNSIINGGNQENSGWRTPTNEEWNYIINDRVTASGIRYAKAVVNDVKGVVVLPDNWLESTYTLNNTNSNNSDFNSNIINAEEWTNTLESNGAVFLPAAGYRYSNVQVYYAGGRGFYWSASYDSWDKAYSLNFSINSVNANSNNARFDGHSVRLVRYAE